MKSLVLGIDLGTQGARATLYNESGECQKRGESAINSDIHAGNAWWQAVERAAREALQEILPSDIAAVGVGAHAPSLVAVTEDLQPIGPTLTWQDRRAAPWEKKLGIDSAPAEQRLGLRLLAQTEWLRTEHPKVHERARWFLQASEYIVARLRKQDFLAPDIPIVNAGVDAFLDLYGSGASQPGEACLGCGTSTSLTVVVEPEFNDCRKLWDLHVFSPQSRAGASLLHHDDLPDPADGAALCAVAAELLNEAQQKGANVSQITAVGGLARLPWLNKMRADTLGIPVVTVDDPQTVCRGAARVAGEQVQINLPAASIVQRYTPS